MAVSSLEIMLHQEWCKVSLFTEKSIAALLPICALLKVWFLHDMLQWCNLCSCRHSSNQISFPDHLMSPDHQKILKGLLDGNLDFTWTTDGYQLVVFSICQYFFLDQDYVLPIFLRSLTPTCARFDDQYQYLELVYKMAEAQYDVLASFLLDYLNNHSFCLFVPQSLLFRTRSLNRFLSSAWSLLNRKSLRRKDYSSAINHSHQK